MPKLILVDGSSYLYRAFHALPDLRTSRGEPTGAIRGVVAMLRRLVVDGKPDYFAVVFDAPGKTFRDDWYPEYKATRQPMPDPLGAQIAPLHELIRAHGWPLLMIDRVEADDVIGSLVCKAQSAGIESLVSTGDKDLAQLVTPHVTLVNTMSNEKLDEAGVLAKFGVRAGQVLDLLTLTGDAIDNVPGVAKVGPKTAAKWLVQYGTLDEVIAHANEIPGVVGENLRAALDWLPQGRKLLTIRCDCTLPVEATDLVIGARDVPRIRTMYERYGFKQWLKDDPDRDSGNDAAAKIADRAARENTRSFTDAGARDASVMGEAPPPVPRHYETVLDNAALERWIEAIERAGLVCFDTETTSIDPMQARIVGLAFAIVPGRACYIPLAHRYPGAPDQLPLEATLARFASWFANPAKFKVGQNLKYDQHVLANHGIALAGIVHDTLLQSYVLEAHRPHDMDSLAWRHLNVKTIAYADVAGKGAKQIDFDQVDIEGATRYSAEDADIALQLHRYLYPRIAADMKLERVYSTIEMPVSEVL